VAEKLGFCISADRRLPLSVIRRKSTIQIGHFRRSPVGHTCEEVERYWSIKIPGFRRKSGRFVSVTRPFRPAREIARTCVDWSTTCQFPTCSALCNLARRSPVHWKKGGLRWDANQAYAVYKRRVKRQIRMLLDRTALGYLLQAFRDHGFARGVQPDAYAFWCPSRMDTRTFVRAAATVGVGSVGSFFTSCWDAANVD